MDRVQKLLDFNTRLMHNLLLKYAVQLGAFVTCNALVKLMHNILPYLSSPTICYTNTTHRGHVHLGQVHLLVSDILTSSNRDYTQKTGLASVHVLLKSILLRLLRKFAVSDSVRNTNFEPLIDQLNYLIKLYLNDVHRLNHVDINKHLQLVVYEIYRFIELSSQMVTFPIKTNLRALMSAKSYICSIFAQLGPEAAWKHFSLVDQELTATKRNSQEVALFKFLATHGYARLEPGNHKMVNPKSSVEVRKDINKPVPGTVDSKGESGQASVEPQLEPKDPVESKAPTTTIVQEEFKKSFEMMETCEELDSQPPEADPQMETEIDTSGQESRIQNSSVLEEKGTLEHLKAEFHDLQMELGQLTDQYPQAINRLEHKLAKIKEIIHKH